MSIVVDNDTKLVVSGLTGREGSFHGLRNRAYGTDLVAGVTPGKGGQDVEGVPVFDSIKESVQEAGANTSMIFVPARFAAPAIDEAIESGVQTVIAITEGIPVLDMLKTYWKAKEAGVRLMGPNCPCVLSLAQTRAAYELLHPSLGPSPRDLLKIQRATSEGLALYSASRPVQVRGQKSP
jgi:succinyl-CoA synthetase alpha subunit